MWLRPQSQSVSGWLGWSTRQSRSLRGRVRRPPDLNDAARAAVVSDESEIIVTPVAQDPTTVAAAVRARRGAERLPYADDVGTVRLNRKTQALPTWLREAVARVLAESRFPKKVLRADCRKLHDFLFSREVIPGVAAEAAAAGPAFAPGLVYGPREAIAHLASRYPMCYGAAAAVFAEARLRLPDFAPKHVLDFGSGAGAATAASTLVWRKSLTQATCVDSSLDMSRLAESLLDAVRTGSEDSPLNNIAIHQRALLPGVKAGENAPYDLVVASFSLCEIPEGRIRRTVVEHLWSVTAGCLVLIESGSRQGFGLIAEAREWLAETEISLSSDDCSSVPARVVSPCPHLGACPRGDLTTPCHFPIRMEYPSGMRFLRQEERHGLRSEKLSYLILARPETLQSASENSAFGRPRIVGQPKQRAGHIYFDICQSEPNDIAQVVVPRSTGKVEWEDAKSRAWGDTFPPFSRYHTAPAE
eukprot:m.442323 g.442323  ORF g.442323 m.442323 type:complete len:473 (-) comp18790_c0_seq1:1505-2923(-)